MSHRFSFFTLTCCLTAAACSAGPDARDHDTPVQPAAAVEAHGPTAPRDHARVGSDAVVARGPCAAPDGYTGVQIGEVLDDPDAYEGELVQIAALVDWIAVCTIQCDGLGVCEHILTLQMQLVGPADGLDVVGGLEMFAADGTKAVLAWGAIEISESGLPAIVVEGFCPDPVVPCGLYGPDCPSTMSCTLDDCGWNGGNCGINPPGTCGFH